MFSPHQTLNLPRDLGGGLVMRLATPDDVEPVAEFNTQIHLEEGEPPDFLRLWTRMLMAGEHPTTSAADFVLVEDTRAGGRIVSATGLIPQEWAYEDIPFKVGRPELVGTDPAYRRRGLVRATFDTIHALSAAYGHQVQVITGIPWFYRQFDYEYALDLGGVRILPTQAVPALAEGESETYTVRPAAGADIPALVRLYERCRAGRVVTVPMGEARWRYELTGHRYTAETWCLLDGAGQVVGACSGSATVWHSYMTLWEVTVEAGVSLRAVLPTVTRALKAHGQAYLAAQGGEEQELAGIRFALGSVHPAYEAFDSRLGPQQPPYGWYVRVPDLPAFVRHLAPVLERRLAASVMSGFSGDLCLDFYRDGLRLAFEQGRLAAAEPGQGDGHFREGAGFPPLVFLQLLFGYRSLAELRYAFPDCRADEEATLLLNALFPKKGSWILPVA